MNTNPFDIKIESGVPLPPKKNKAGAWELLMLCMKIGDSFEVRSHTTTTIRGVAKKLNIEIVARTLGKDHYRIWRMK